MYSVQGEIEFFDDGIWKPRTIEELVEVEILGESDGFTYGLIGSVIPIRYLSSPKTFVRLMYSEEASFV